MFRVTILGTRLARAEVEFDCIPLTNAGDFRCEPESAISFVAAQKIADEIHWGSVSGYTNGVRWLRQFPTPRTARPSDALPEPSSIPV